MQHKEYDEQIAFIKWCKLATYTYPDLALIYCNHNTQRLNKMQAMRWKLLGGRAGVPDIFLPVGKWCDEYNGARDIQYLGLYIELKSPDLKPKTIRSKGGLSDEQLEFFPMLEKNGYKVVVCYSWIEAKKAIEEYLCN